MEKTKAKGRRRPLVVKTELIPKSISLSTMPPQRWPNSDRTYRYGAVELLFTVAAVCYFVSIAHNRPHH